MSDAKRWAQIQLWALRKLDGLLSRFGYTPQWIRQRILALYIRTPEGRQKLSQAMRSPIQKRLEENRLARQIMPLQTIPEEALPSREPSPPKETP